MKALRWALFNGVMLTCLYSGFTYDFQALVNIGLILVWASIVLSFFLVSDQIAKELQKEMKSSSIPYTLDVIYDFAVFMVLAYFGWIITSVFYLFHMGMIGYVRQKEFE